MASLSVLSGAFRPHVARIAVVGTFAVLLVMLGFLVPLWTVAVVGAGCATGVAAVRKVRTAARTIDQILADELSD